MRFDAIGGKQNTFDGRWKDVDAANDQHIVRATLDLAHARHRASTRAFLAIQRHAITRTIAQ